MPTERAMLSKLVRNMESRDTEPLRPMIDAYLIEREHADDRVQQHVIDMRPRMRPGGRFSPSSLCGCLRAAAFKFTSMPGQRRLDPDLELIFEDGNWRHHKWQAMTMDMQAVLGPDRFLVLSFEAMIEIPELYIAGNSDEVVKVGGRKRVIDYKGINEWGFARINAEDAPIPEHVRQIHPYMKGHRLKRSSLFYDNKNNQHTKIFSVDFDQSVWFEIVEWIEDCLELINGEKLPPMHPDCTAGNFLYSKCAYSSICYGTRTDVQIRRKMYKEFPGVEEAWEASREVMRDEENQF